jgi:hypothetical protein
MRLVAAFVLLSSLGLSGCLSTVRVKAGPTGATSDTQKYDNVPGIPFYNKIAMCKEETVWAEPAYTLTLKKTTTYKFVDEAKAKAAGAKLPDPFTRSATKVLSLSQFQPSNSDLQSLLSTLNKTVALAEPDITEVDTDWTALNAKPDYVPLSIPEDEIGKSHDAMLIAETSASEMLVDYSKTYYLNAPRPWVGTSQVDEKLGPDGTLTEGSAQVQGQTLSTVLTAVTSVLSGVVSKLPALGAPGQPTTPPPDATQVTVVFELTVKKDIYQHTHTRYINFANPCPVEIVNSGYALTISSSNQAPPSKTDANTVTVNGTITLPKAAASVPAPAPK